MEVKSNLAFYGDEQAITRAWPKRRDARLDNHCRSLIAREGAKRNPGDPDVFVFIFKFSSSSAEKFRSTVTNSSLAVCGIACRCELVAVAVARINHDPVVINCPVNPALEITVAHIKKIIALKHAARRHLVARENAEDLAADFIIGKSIRHKDARRLRGVFNSIVKSEASQNPAP